MNVLIYIVVILLGGAIILNSLSGLLFGVMYYSERITNGNKSVKRPVLIRGTRARLTGAGGTAVGFVILYQVLSNWG